MSDATATDADSPGVRYREQVADRSWPALCAGGRPGGVRSEETSASFAAADLSHPVGLQTLASAIVLGTFALIYR